MQTINQTAFLNLSVKDRKTALESLIFSSEEPLSSKQIINMLVNVEFSIPNIKSSKTDDEENIGIREIYLPDEPEFTENYFDNLINEINTDLALTARPYRIVKVGGGWQFGLMSDFGQMLHKHFKTKVKKKLSQAALETLAIVAYKQPVSKPEIEQIRGVNSNEVVNSLIEKNLVKIAGRSESLGKPLLYATTGEFLRTFGINTLDDLPKLKELEEISPNKPEGEVESNDITLKITENLNSDVENDVVEIIDEQIFDSDFPEIDLKPEYID